MNPGFLHLQEDSLSSEPPGKPTISRANASDDKVIANLDSALKIRDILLLTKVHIDKAMVFPVVMYRCEHWTIKKAEWEELMLSNCGVGEDS